MVRRRLVAAFATALAVAACGGTGTAAPSASPSGTLPGGALPSGGLASNLPRQSAPGLPSAQLVLRVADVGGFVGPQALRTRLPSISLYADGSIITLAAVPAIYPGPLVPQLVIRSVGPAGAAAILKAAADAGLTHADATYPARGVADAPSTVVTVVHSGTTTTTTFDAFGIDAGQAMPPAESALRAATFALVGHLTFDDGTFGPSTKDSQYVPAGFRIWVTAGAPKPSDTSLARPPVAWPLATPLDRFGQPDVTAVAPSDRVADVVGAGAALLAPVLGAATEITPFSSAGSLYTLMVRPLLPDEAAAATGG